MLTSHLVTCFSVLAHEQRYQIMRALVKAGPEGMSLNGLSTSLHISRTSLKRHISRLTDTHLVNTRKQGRVVNCQANTEKLADLLKTIDLGLEAKWRPQKEQKSPKDIIYSSLRDRLGDVEPSALSAKL